jgi:hypothetical protein
MRNVLPFRKLAHASILLLASWLSLRDISGLDGTEFSGGWLTGPILNMCEIAITFFVVGIVLAYPFPRIASVTSLLASLLSLPFLLYWIAPGPFRSVFKGEYSVPLQSNFVWNKWSLETTIAILIVMAMSVWNLFSVHRIERPAIGERSL